MRLRMKRRLRFALTVTLSMALAVAQHAVATADDVAQGKPGFSGCGGAKNAIGPCVGSNSWDGGTGAGCGTCGNIGDVTYTFTGGTCQGKTAGPYNTNNCTTCNVPTSKTDGYTAVSRSTLSIAACVSAATAGAVGLTGVLCIAGCCGVTGFTTAGIGTCAGGGCFALCGLIVGGLSTAALACIFGACFNTCSYTGSATAGSTSACS